MENPMAVAFRQEIPADLGALDRVNISAFGRKNEAILVRKLRENSSVLSFVAVQEGTVIGHILYSLVSFDTDVSNSLCILGLAPMAVLPDYQRQGVGSGLIWYSLRECGDRGFDAVVVLGHADFYPRFGFQTASRKGLSCEYVVPDEVFMVKELREGCLEGLQGLVRYREEFDEV
jgi:putative acetyltransferase